MLGDNPVCHLCNYQTYALYHLMNVTKLDTLNVTDEARQMADATFVKKRMSVALSFFSSSYPPHPLCSLSLPFLKPIPLFLCGGIHSQSKGIIT